MRLIPFAIAIALLVAGPALSAPVTLTFTGTLSSDKFVVNTSGTLAGLFDYGDTFTMTTTFDDAQSPDWDNFHLGSHGRAWWSGTAISVSINGETFAIGGSGMGDNDRGTAARDGLDPDHRDIAAVKRSSGYAAPFDGTSTLSNIGAVFLEWRLIGPSVYDYNDPDFPTLIDLDDWNTEYISFATNDWWDGTDQGAAGFYSTATDFVFDGALPGAGGGAGVPSPGAIALLGAGLAGMGVMRRRKAT